MSFHSLKFKIAGNLAIVIFISVLFSDLVIVSVIQKSLIRDRAARGRALLQSLPDALGNDPVSAVGLSVGNSREGIYDPAIVFLKICLEDGREYRFGEPGRDVHNWIHQIEMRTSREGKGRTDFFGEIFGVFWHQKKFLMISEPAASPGLGKSGVQLMVLQLDDIYETLRGSQKIIFFYGIANFVILLMFGVYRLSRLVIRPIHRFIKMTDEFREKDRLYFTRGKNYPEFNQLSKALNHMLDLIETDKENLQHSLGELEKANQELKTAQKEIVQAEKLASVGRLSAGIAHEIGNPISILLGYLDLLTTRSSLKKDDTAQDYVKRMQSEVNRIHQIIRQLLDFSRSTPEGTGAVSMHDLVRDVVEMMSAQPLMQDINFDFRPSKIADTIAIDKERMRQVLVNLIINAADSIYAAGRESNGKIHITSEYIPANSSSALNHRPMFLLRIRDNGCGIAEENINCIFDPFFTTKPTGKGTGLGLSVSYMIIEQAGGRMIVESKIDQGTSMMIYLPINEGA